MAPSISASLAFCNSGTLLPQISALLFNPGMASLKEIRLANLHALIAAAGTVAELARKIDTDPIYLRQLKDQVPDSKTGRPRQMGNRLAAKIEAAYALEAGAMDRPMPDPMTGSPDSEAVSEATSVIGSLEQLQSDWKALPEGWRFHLCRKARKLREWSDQLPVFVRDSIKPIQDDSEYHAWEKRLEESLAEREREDESQQRQHDRRRALGADRRRPQ